MGGRGEVGGLPNGTENTLETAHYAIRSFFFAGHLDIGLRTVCFLKTFLCYLAGRLCTERFLHLPMSHISPCQMGI